MSILYALVAHGTRVLTEHTIDSSQNFSKASSTILSKLPPNDSRLTYSADEYLFHYIKKDDSVFMCMSEGTSDRKIPFLFLTELQRKFNSSYSRSEIASAPPFGLNSFTPHLLQLITTYNIRLSSKPSGSSTAEAEDPNDSLRQARSELSNVKEIMIKNVGEILNRGERIELLLDKTDNLSSQSNAFRKRSQVLRRRMWWKNTRMIALSGMVVVMIVYILLAQACGAALNHCGS
ncbi:synaptobrevin-domain-containing protein [Phakopsora pachyrhizi]|uniref:Synaptobrevin homolog YKT6 n=1 Tax=Phakopsora pachyrhizi TaxID=170000 RepID=A0AAV0B1G4_PHAPC|nr:synaptobrevin-domain-containing protein [Phakopsora pachyrhizi]CAH7677038.1 synaptobrevin-domain-containing protein [Phakopsora pachyrhizi]